MFQGNRSRRNRFRVPAPAGLTAAAISPYSGPMTAQLPAVSILTPCLNGAAFVAEMAESVRDQAGVALEHLVMDGGSRDGTLEILARFPHLRVVSEADRGSHDAMNRALTLAQGEIVGFLNTDDRYAPGVLAEVARRFAASPALDTLLARSCVLARRGAAWEIAGWHPLCRGDGLDLDDLMYGVPCINARFFRRRVFERIGDFALEFDYAADRHFLLRLALAGARGATLDRLGYYYRSHEASRTLNREGRRAVEIGLEHVGIARALLATDGLAPAARRALAGWLAYEQLRALARGVGNARWQETLAQAAAIRFTDLPRGCAGKLGAIQRRRETQAPAA
jgi:glycosyltransferase involved in cell wall biosynthesis